MLNIDDVVIDSFSIVTTVVFRVYLVEGTQVG